MRDEKHRSVELAAAIALEALAVLYEGLVLVLLVETLLKQQAALLG